MCFNNMCTVFTLCTIRALYIAYTACPEGIVCTVDTVYIVRRVCLLYFTNLVYLVYRLDAAVDVVVVCEILLS